MSNQPPNAPDARRGAAPPPVAGGQHTGDKTAQGRRFSTGQLLGALLFVITLVFIFENTRKVKVRLIIPEVSAPLALPIVIAAVLGAGVAWFLRYRRHRRTHRR